jgi:hypothetical protein
MRAESSVIVDVIVLSSVCMLIPGYPFPASLAASAHTVMVDEQRDGQRDDDSEVVSH